MHFASGGDVSDHSGAQLEAMALAVEGAAANAGQHEFRLFRIAEINVDFDAAEGRCNLIGDPRDQFFNVESRGDPLGKFLQAYQFHDPERRRVRHGLAGETEIHERGGGHDKTLLPVDCNLA